MNFHEMKEYFLFLGVNQYLREYSLSVSDLSQPVADLDSRF